MCNIPFALNLVFNFAYANISYLAWVAFATVLQLTITYLNMYLRGVTRRG